MAYSKIILYSRKRVMLHRPCYLEEQEVNDENIIGSITYDQMSIALDIFSLQEV